MDPKDTAQVVDKFGLSIGVSIMMIRKVYCITKVVFPWNPWVVDVNDVSSLLAVSLGDLIYLSCEIVVSIIANGGDPRDEYVLNPPMETFDCDVHDILSNLLFTHSWVPLGGTPDIIGTTMDDDSLNLVLLKDEVIYIPF